jgi:Ca2+-transporting ATPase
MQNGLDQNQVLILRRQYGRNVLPKKENNSAFFIFLQQFKSPLIYILLIAVIISLFTSEITDVYLIGFVILLNVAMGFYQEYSAQKTLKALQNIIKNVAIVIRNGDKREVNVEDLVPRDLVVLGSGDKIPADGKLIEGVNFLVNEAILTGEEEAVSKTIDSKTNNLFMGTTVLAGSGIMEVEKIGPSTQIGKIGKSLEEVKNENTPLQNKLNNFAKVLALIILAVAAIIFVVGVIFQGRGFLEMLRLSIVLAVAAIPEGLSIAVTIIMALGMRRILKKHGLVKRLISIETLGSTMVICTDKTGTLTEGKMQVVKADFKNEDEALKALVLDNDERTNLEIALLNYVKQKGLNQHNIHDTNKRIYQEPFNSAAKYSMSVNEKNNSKTAYLLGAPDIMINFCKLNQNEKKVILEQIADWSQEGLRMLGVALKKNNSLDKLKEKSDFTYLGLLAIRDPLRPHVQDSIAEAKEAGVITKIVTGDYLGTAINVAKQIGLRTGPENVIDGERLRQIPEHELEKRLKDIDVFARVTPEEKLKIIHALQKQDQVVAMTGDGVNDAPALKKAEIGVVVGEKASEVAKEVGDLILLDGNFKTIVSAIEEGRLVFSNIKKVIAYVLSNSFAEIILIFGAMIVGLPAPLAVVQILWVHLICDGPPDVMLSFEPEEKYLMREKPQTLIKEEILDSTVKILVFLISFITGLSALVFFWYTNKTTGNFSLSQTVAFATIGMVSLVYIFSFKSFRKSLFTTEHFFANKYLILSVIYGWVLLLSAIYVPALNKLLNTTPLGIRHWLMILPVGIILTILVEIAKIYTNKKRTVSQSGPNQ